MRIQRKFNWNEFKKFRHQSNLPDFEGNITIGSGKVKLETTLDNLVIEDNPSLNHFWTFEEDLFYEKIDFEGGLTIRMKTIITEKQKLSFLEQWFKEKGVLCWGILNGDTSKMKSSTMGWALLENLNEYIYENNPFKELVDGKSSPEKLWQGGSMHDDYMAHSFTFRKKDGREEEPNLNTIILNGGVYFTYLEPVEKSERYFATYLSQEEEKRHTEQLLVLADMIKHFLNTYVVEFDSMRGVISLN